jgi:alpha-tubulin suppressor-like RCC1 family protein
MRRALILLALASAVAGCGTRDCKPDTALVRITFTGAAATADSLAFTITIGKGTPVHTTIPHPAGHTPDTTQLTFNHYPAGQSIVVAVVASRGGQLVGSGTASGTLAQTCTVLGIAISGSGSVGDGGTGGVADDGGSDAGKANGAVCGAGDICASGNCVDGYCCDTACTDSCSACDVSGKPGICSPVVGAVHGTRTACTGFGSAPCDGTSTQCSYPTVTCGSQSCSSGVATSTGTCSMGSCMLSGTGTTNCADKLCGAKACQTVTQVAVGGDFACALLSDTTVRCWGNNSLGQLGQGGTDTTERTTPTAVPGLSNVTSIVAGDLHACAIITDPTSGNTTVQCWGNNNDGELGLGSVVDGSAHPTPKPVPGLTGVLQIAAGSFNTCAVLNNQQVKCWGDNLNGQVGDGTDSHGSVNNTRTAPTTVCASGSAGTCTAFTGAVQVAVGIYFACVATGGGTVYCWGTNNEDELGTPTTDSNAHDNPVQVNVSSYVVNKLVAGAYSACAMVSDPGMHVRCWGYGASGQLGSGSVPASSVSQPVSVCTTASCGSLLGGVTDITMGNFNNGSTACAIASSAVYCWGANTNGQMGLGSTDTAAHPYAVPSLITSSSMPAGVATYGNYTCVRIQNGGTMRCFGKNGADSLIGIGDTTTASVTMPTAQKW